MLKMSRRHAAAVFDPRPGLQAYRPLRGSENSGSALGQLHRVRLCFFAALFLCSAGFLEALVSLMEIPLWILRPLSDKSVKRTSPAPRRAL
jgi:hypothetical protein